VFFFQAEDGIRDDLVTGVQTCALPILHEAHDLAALAPNVVVKIPMTSEGLVAVRKLHKEGIKTNVTLVFSPNQALLAAKAGAGRSEERRVGKECRCRWSRECVENK